jgi:hypothetical protein
MLPGIIESVAFAFGSGLLRPGAQGRFAPRRREPKQGAPLGLLHPANLLCPVKVRRLAASTW